MHRPTSSSSFASLQRQDGCWTIISDLLVLIQCVQMSIKAVELATEFHGCDEVADNVFILDDVTPLYVIAKAALDACQAQLREALCSVLEAKLSAAGAKRRG
jgi:hypothetical protein